MPSNTRIAVVGSGISGLVSALVLAREHEVTLFEADTRVGGHTNTVEVTIDGAPAAVDTGFIVYNDRTYPGFIGLLAHLGVPTQSSDMSFSVRDERTGLEWCGTSPSSLFAQRRNLVSRPFHRMLRDVVRFNRAARRLVDAGTDDGVTLGEFVAARGWSRELLEWYLVPMGSAIWSADPRTFADIPAVTFARFFENHGLLRLGDRPRWRAVTGGSARYVDAIVDRLGDRVRTGVGIDKVVRRDGGIELHTTGGDSIAADHVVLAVHSDQALRLLADPTIAEREVLGAIRYQPNLATLHTDERLLPRSRRAWASWNYHRLDGDRDQVAVTYLMNRLQQAPWSHPVLVTLNHREAIDDTAVLADITYTHPVFDAAAVAAQSRHGEISGRDGVSFAGAYWGNGFHEDGVQSALRVCRALGVEEPW